MFYTFLGFCRSLFELALNYFNRNWPKFGTNLHYFFRAVGIAAGPPWRPAVDAESPDIAAPSASIATGRPAIIRLATIYHRANREDQRRAARRESPPRISLRLSTRSTPRRCHPPGSRRGSDVAVLGTISDRPDRSTTSHADRARARVSHKGSPL